MTKIETDKKTPMSMAKTKDMGVLVAEARFELATLRV